MKYDVTLQEPNIGLNATGPAWTCRVAKTSDRADVRTISVKNNLSFALTYPGGCHFVRHGNMKAYVLCVEGTVHFKFIVVHHVSRVPIHASKFNAR